MADIIKCVSVQKGYDPREFSTIAFGGAGPVHATRLAEEVSILKIIIPIGKKIQDRNGCENGSKTILVGISKDKFESGKDEYACRVYFSFVIILPCNSNK